MKAEGRTTFHRVKEIDYVPNPEDFASYVSSNTPLRIIGGAISWPAIKKWNLQTKEGKEYLMGVYPSQNNTVDVEILEGTQDTFYGDERYTTATTLPFATFVQKAKCPSGGSSEHLYLNQCILYSKTQQPQLPALMNDIEFPEFLDREAVSSVNLWISFGGTRSNFHYDCSMNVLCELQGIKRLLLLDPSHGSLLGANPVQLNAPNHCKISIPGPDEVSPLFEEIRQKALHVDLHPGDMLFIPEGWYHCVESLPPIVVAVNFWWPGFDLQLNSLTGTCMASYYLRRMVQEMVKTKMEETLSGLLKESEKEPEKTEEKEEQSKDQQEQKGGKRKLGNGISSGMKRQRLEQDSPLRRMIENAITQREKEIDAGEDKEICRLLLAFEPTAVLRDFEALAHQQPGPFANFLCDSLSPMATHIWTHKLEALETTSPSHEEDEEEGADELFGVLAAVKAGALTTILRKKESFATEVLTNLVHQNTFG